MRWWPLRHALHLKDPMRNKNDRPVTALRKVLRMLGAIVLVPVIFFEEWGWRPLARLMARIGALPIVRNLEARISKVPPRAALALFLVPVIVLLPFKFGALWLIAHGQKTLGILVIIAAKLVSTAFLGRLFVLTEAQLMSIGWFARAYNGWRGLKERVVARVKASASWRATVIAGKRLKRWMARS